MTQVKKIPYGLARFEHTSNYLFLIRPRRFGKSVFVTMLQAYYDIAKADHFDTLFDGLWIQQHPTPLKNAFQVIYFDFSLIGASGDVAVLEENFSMYCGQILDRFADDYGSFYEEEFVRTVKSLQGARHKLNYINIQAKAKGYPLYLIIDEYDNFTNVILSDGGKDLFRNLTHASGFYREYFKLFKAMFNRVFLIGVSPVTLDDLSSGYNIDWNISQDPRFNAMLGFSEAEVREMFRYYQENGKLRPEADIEAMLAEMKPWYNNYCFSPDCLKDDRLYNCDMVFYYLRHQVLYGRAPREMVDKNIRTDYKKLKMLADIDRGNQREDRMSVIEEIAATGTVTMTLKTSFPAEYVTEDSNFRSLLYYYGLLTMDHEEWGELKMVIPNNCVKEQYWAFMRDYFQRSEEVDLTALRNSLRGLAKDGDWQTLIRQIAAAYKATSSIRDSILGEHNLLQRLPAPAGQNPIPGDCAQLHPGTEIRESHGIGRPGGRKEPRGGRTTGKVQPGQHRETPVRRHATAPAEGGVQRGRDGGVRVQPGQHRETPVRRHAAAPAESGVQRGRDGGVRGRFIN